MNVQGAVGRAPIHDIHRGPHDLSQPGGEEGIAGARESQDDDVVSPLLNLAAQSDSVAVSGGDNTIDEKVDSRVEGHQIGTWVRVTSPDCWNCHGGLASKTW